MNSLKLRVKETREAEQASYARYLRAYKNHSQDGVCPHPVLGMVLFEAQVRLEENRVALSAARAALSAAQWEEVLLRTAEPDLFLE